MQTFSWLLGAAILAVGCGPATGETTSSSGGVDAGPEVVQVNLDGGGAPATPPDGASLCPQDGICNYQTGAGLASFGLANALLWDALNFTKPSGFCGGLTGYWGDAPQT